MALPTKPVLGYSFTANSTSNPSSQQPGPNLDAEYNRSNLSISQLIDYVAISINADGTLKSSAVQAAIDAGSGSTPPDGVNISDIPSQQSASLSQAWAEHMPDELPADTLAIAGITGQHWSSRWWAAQAAQKQAAGSGAAEYLVATRTGLIIPYYVYVVNPYNDPAFSAFLTLIRTNQTIPVIVILNQSGSDGLGGPGPTADLAVAQMIRMLRAAGATVCGYVSTQNGTRSSALVNADILLWNQLYAGSGAPLDGVFFDELPYAVGPGNANIDLYRNYYTYAHNNGYTLVIGNPGTQQVSAWYDANVADIYVTYENTSWPPLSVFSINPPSYISGATTDYDREKFAVLVYNSAWSASGFTTLAPYFGWIYATDNPPPASVGSPWSALPTYLATMFAAATAAGAAGVTTFNGRTGAVTLTAADVTGTNVMAAPGPIGGTTPAAGTFSTAAIAGAAATFRNLDFRSSASMRMRWSLNNTAEGGANAGSDLDLFTYNDAGSPLLSPAFRLTRSTGAAQFYGALGATGNVAFGSNTAPGEQVLINAAAGQNRLLTFASAGSSRWLMGVSNTAESGANAGSDLFVNRYDDAGAFLDAPLTVARSNGAVAIKGINSAAGAAAGMVGEFVNTVSASPGTALITGSCSNVAIMGLSAGDWDVYGTVGLLLGGTTAMSSFQAGISTTSATMPGFAQTNGCTQLITGSMATGFPAGLSAGACRLSLSGATNVYLLATVGFSVSTCSAYGVVWARRAR